MSDIHTVWWIFKRAIAVSTVVLLGDCSSLMETQNSRVLGRNEDPIFLYIQLPPLSTFHELFLVARFDLIVVNTRVLLVAA